VSARKSKVSSLGKMVFVQEWVPENQKFLL